MRILLLCNKSPWPPKDGGASATLNLIKGLSSGKISVTVLAQNTPKHFVNFEDIPDELKHTIQLKLIDVDSEIKIISLILNLLFSGKPYNMVRFRSENYSEELIKLASEKFDLIQIEGLAMLQYIDEIRKITTAPVIFRPHNIEHLIWLGLSFEERNIFKKKYFRLLSRRLKLMERKLVKKCDGIIPMSEDDLKWFRSAGCELPGLVIYPGIDPGSITEFSDESSKKIFFIGALDWLPNIYGLNWFINNVWPLIIRRVPASEFHVAGRNASEKTISGIKGRNVFFTGEVDSSEKFISDKTIMVVPLFSGSGVRIKIIEAMAFGKAVVTTPTGAKGLICEDKKDVFIATNAAFFAKQIITLMMNPQMRRESRENAINNVRKNYNIFASAERLINFYGEIIE